MTDSYKQPNFTAYVKYFSNASTVASGNNWVNSTHNDVSVLTPANKGVDVYIPNNLTVGGSFYNPSDIKLKENIEDLDLKWIDNIMLLNPKQYTYKQDSTKTLHYGFIAQEMEPLVPHLVGETTLPGGETMKTVNYLELIPILLMKIQDMQKQIDELKSK